MHMHDHNNLVMTSNKPLLLACKLQLSSEVIHWKTENLSLQKERDLAIQNSNTLLTRVTQLEEENKRLKQKNVYALDEEKALNIQRLSQSSNKLNSFPFTSNDSINPTMSKFLRQGIVDPEKYQNQVSADYEEVSQEIFKRMLQEMKERHGINLCDKVNNSDQDEDSSDCRREVEESISSLLTDTKALKCNLLNQNKKIRLLLQNVIKDVSQKDSVVGNGQNISSVVNKQPVTDLQCINKFNSDDLIQQLEGISELRLQNKSDSFNSENICTMLLFPESQIQDQHHIEELNTTPEREKKKLEEKVCPICQQQFDNAFPHALFEEHVVNHLEAESESILEQYEIL